MSSESIALPIAPELGRLGTATRPRIGLRLTATERKYLLRLTDLILVNGSLLAAVTIWNGFPLSLPALLDNAKWFITLSVLWLIVATILDVYNLARSANTTNIVIASSLAVLLSAFIYLAIPWLTPPLGTRSYAFGFLLFSVLAVVAWRVFYAQALIQPAFRRRVLILREGKSAQALLDALSRDGQADSANPFCGTGYQIVGLVADRPTQLWGGAGGIPLLGPARQVVRLARQHAVDEIVVALDDAGALSPEAREALLDCRELGLPVSPLPTVYERLTGRLPVDYAQYDMSLILGPADSLASRLYATVKRLLDILLALVGLVVLAQLSLVVALCNALWSPGPLFYRQQRVGRGGRPFAVLKFRSMIPNAERISGTVWCDEKDPRITPVGRWLRKSRLDELPQVVNVLRGEMSIVGPRPERPHFVGQLTNALPVYRARNAVKPGITGWAQVCYRYGSSVEDGRVKLEYDLYYVKNANIYMDLHILLQTVPVVLGLQGR